MRDFILYKQNSVISNEASFRKFIKEIPDGKYLIKVENRKLRSLSANRYYWAILPLILDGLRDAGYDDVRDKDDVHYLLKVMFLKRKIVNHQTGEVIGEISRSTTELSTLEFSEYIERIAQWCAEYLSIELPPPNTQLKILQ